MPNGLGALEINAIPFSEKEVDFWRGLLLRSDQFIVSHSNVPELKSSIKPMDEPEELCVVAVSFKLPFPTAKHIVGPARRGRHCKVFNDDYSTVGYSLKSIRDNIFDCFERIVDEINSKYTVHFVLFNELAVSFKDMESIEKNDLEKVLLGKLAAKMYKNQKIKFFLLPGTFHCPRSFQNVAPIISPFDQPVPINQTWGFQNHVVKQNRACKGGLEEKIKTSDNRELIIFRTPYGTFTEWICLDMYDPSLVLKLLRRNYRHSSSEGEHSLIDLLFVPSFNPDSKDRLKEAAEEISEHCRLTMILSNHYASASRAKRGWTDSFCFAFGTRIRAKKVIRHEDYIIKVFGIKNWRARREKQSPIEKSGPSSASSFLLGGSETYIVPDKE